MLPKFIFVYQFTDRLDSFNISQIIIDPTHEKGHTLDLVLSGGLSPDIIDICKFAVCDHKAVIIIVPLQIPTRPQPSQSYFSRILNANSASLFCAIFNPLPFDIHSPNLDPKIMLETLLLHSQTVLDQIAPLTLRKINK